MIADDIINSRLFHTFTREYKYLDIEFSKSSLFVFEIGNSWSLPRLINVPHNTTGHRTQNKKVGPKFPLRYIANCSLHTLTLALQVYTGFFLSFPSANF